MLLRPICSVAIRARPFPLHADFANDLTVCRPRPQQRGIRSVARWPSRTSSSPLASLRPTPYPAGMVHNIWAAPLQLSNFNIIVAVLGGFVSLFGLISYLLKENYYLSEAREFASQCHARSALSRLPGGLRPRAEAMWDRRNTKITDLVGEKNSHFALGRRRLWTQWSKLRPS